MRRRIVIAGIGLAVITALVAVIVTARDGNDERSAQAPTELTADRQRRRSFAIGRRSQTRGAHTGGAGSPTRRA